MNEMTYVLQAWLPLVVWQQVDAPEYLKGFVMSFRVAVTGVITKVLHEWQIRRHTVN